MSLDRDSDFKRYGICVIQFVAYMTLEALQIVGYAVSNPALFPLFILFFVFIPLISFVAWWYVGYRGSRAINPPSNQPLLDP
ncbi:MAG: hypothetical protein ACFFED_11865 [Candidatus Thorarchaeota archaeon]